MDWKEYKPFLVVIGLLLGASLVLAITVDTEISDQAGVEPIFPDQVGEWAGVGTRFCQNKVCRKSFTLPELEDPETCPSCGKDLGLMTIAERDMLPSDTILVKSRYAHPSGKAVYAAIVLSGSERASIHRPEKCLRGQGTELVGGYYLDVPFDYREPLPVRVIPMIRHTKTRQGGTKDYHRYYAYWFVGKGRETASHYWRMFYMAADRIFKNVGHRWAYISVSGVRSADSEDYQQEIQDFIRQLYPQMVIESS